MIALIVDAFGDLGYVACVPANETQDTLCHNVSYVCKMQNDDARTSSVWFVLCDTDVCRALVSQDAAPRGARVRPPTYVACRTDRLTGSAVCWCVFADLCDRDAKMPHSVCKPISAQLSDWS